MYKTLSPEIKFAPGLGYYVFAKSDAPPAAGHDLAGFYLQEFGQWARSNPFFFKDEFKAEIAMHISPSTPTWTCEFPGCKVCKK